MADPSKVAWAGSAGVSLVAPAKNSPVPDNVSAGHSRQGHRSRRSCRNGREREKFIDNQLDDRKSVEQGEESG